MLSCDTDDEVPVPVIYEGTIVLRSQADVEKLRGENLTHITGSLEIGPASFGAPTNITDLSPLSELTTVGGSLVLESNNDLTNLRSFKNMREVGMTLVLRNMFGLTNLDALGGLESVGSLLFEHNPNLVSLTALENLTISDAIRLINHEKLSVLPEFRNVTKLTTGLFIGTNPMLTDISGFKYLEEIEKTLYISSAPNTLTSFDLSSLENVGSRVIIQYLGEGDTKLTSLQSLSSLRSVGGEIILTDLDGLTSLHGLHNIESAKDIELDDLDALEEIDAFEKVTSVSSLHVLRNVKLQSLQGFRFITQGATTGVSVDIVDNPLLSQFCDIKTVVSLPNCKVDINGNAQDPTIEEIQENCD